MGQQHIDEFDFFFRFLVARLGFFLARLPAFFQGGDVGEDQLRIDDFNVAHRVHTAQFVNDVVIFKTAHHLHDRIGLADIGEELVPQSGTLRSTFHQTGDVHEFNRGRHQFFRSGNFREHRESGIGHGDHADIRVDRAKRIIRGLRLAGAGYGIEQG